MPDLTLKKLLPKYIEIETSKFCNRLCSWCPNSFLKDRRSHQLMTLETFMKILQELSRANYNGWIALHNYNEPLANPRLYDELTLISEIVRYSKTAIFTNGDLLDERAYDLLVESEIKELRITRYPRPSQTKKYGRIQLYEWLRKKPFLQNLNWQIDEENRRGVVLECNTNSLKIMLIAPNVMNYYDRGGVVPHLSRKQRKVPCFMTKHSLSIDYLGRVKMCCNVVPDAAGHEKYVLGDAENIPVLDVWNGVVFSELKSKHAKADWSISEICETCIQNI